MPTQTVSVNASAHDGEDGNATGSQLDFDENAVGAIFVLTDAIPTGSTITAATVDFTVRASDAGTDTVLDIYVEPTTAPADFDSGGTSVSGRSRTTATVEWTPADAADEATWTTADFTSVVQEVLDSETEFEIGDELCVIFVSDSYEAVTRGAYAYDDTPAKAASLTLEWTEGTTLETEAEVHGDGWLEAQDAEAYVTKYVEAEAHGETWLAANATVFSMLQAESEIRSEGWLAAQDAVPALTVYSEIRSEGWLTAQDAQAVTIKAVEAEVHGDGWLSAQSVWMNSVLSSSRLSAGVPLAVGQPVDDLVVSVPFVGGALDTGL